LFVEFGALGFFSGLIAAIWCRTSFVWNCRSLFLNAECESFIRCLWLFGPLIGVWCHFKHGYLPAGLVLKVAAYAFVAWAIKQLFII